ncbi:MAG TPA: OmpA family protein [Steroidobacteraceae bacterium]|nr:OmpA family protein [Steroidobacteraceae bacterium]
MKTFTLVAASALLLAACATPPQRNEQVEQARSEIDTLSQDPLAQQAAAHDLDAARVSLQQADAAFQQRQPPAIVDHLAYLARRHAEAGEARVAQAHAQQEMARAQDERNHILLSSREREAQNAQAQAQSAQAQAQSAQAEAQNARNQALAAQQQLADAQRQLQDLQAKKTDRGMVVTLSDVLFDTGQATLKPGASLALDRLAGYLKSNPQTRVIIEGHTDSRGSDDYNQGLSERRAQAVAMELESRGVPEDQYRTRGLGKSYPVASNDTAAGRQQNRRVEIVFSDASGRFAQGATEPSQQR